MAETTYNEGLATAGTVKRVKLLCDADTYYEGMPLTYDTGTDTYEYSASVVQAIVAEDLVLAAEGYVLCNVTGSEFPSDKLVTDANVALTATQDIINSAMSYGIILR